MTGSPLASDSTRQTDRRRAWEQGQGWQQPLGSGTDKLSKSPLGFPASQQTPPPRCRGYLPCPGTPLSLSLHAGMGGEPHRANEELSFPRDIGATLAAALARLLSPSPAPVGTGFPSELVSHHSIPPVSAGRQEEGSTGQAPTLPQGERDSGWCCCPSPCPSPTQQQIYSPLAGAVEGTQRSATDAAARSCKGRAQQRSPHRKSRGALDKVKQQAPRRHRAEGCNKARHGAAGHAATFPSPGRRSIPPG